MRTWMWTLAAAGAVAGGVAVTLVRARPVSAFSGQVFEVTGTAVFLHFHEPTQPGKRAFKNKANGTIVAEAIRNDNPAPGHNAGGLLESDAGGKCYLRFDSTEQWTMALTPGFGGDTLPLKGFVDGTGAFMFQGYHERSDSTFVATGKVRFQKGTLTPIGLSGKIQGVSPASEHFATGTFKTVGKALAQ